MGEEEAPPLPPLDGDGGPPVAVVRLPRTGAHVVLDGRLFLGPADSASDGAAVAADGVTHVLNAMKEIPERQYPGVEVRRLECWDSPQQRLPFEESAAFVDRCLNGGGWCLVHCNAGQSRSASVVIHYLMTQGHTLQKSYGYVKGRKPDIRPNFGFCSQLQEAELRLFGRVSLDMNEHKVDTLCEILEGGGKTREDVLRALERWNGDGEVALGMLLEE